jgi:glycosyltransferase involved in cell wall biosynthesis
MRGNKLDLLIILNGSNELPSNIVRALQFTNFFTNSSIFEVKYSNSKVIWLEKLCFKLKLIEFIFQAIKKGITKLNKYRIINIARKSDVVYLIKHTDLKFHEALCKLKCVVVYDLNDALWLPAFSVNEFHKFLELSDSVICENEYLSAYCSSLGVQNFVVPDSPQLIEFDKKRKENNNCTYQNKVTIGWVGTQRNVDNLYYIFEELDMLALRYNIKLRILGADLMLPRFENLEISFISNYTQNNMIEEIFKFDIAIFPQFRTEDAYLRGTLKAKIYMAGGIPTIVQKVNGFDELIVNGIDGFIADKREDWYEILEKLITNELMRKNIGQKAIMKIRELYSESIIFSQLESSILKAWEHGKKKNK